MVPKTETLKQPKIYIYLVAVLIFIPIVLKAPVLALVALLAGASWWAGGRTIRGPVLVLALALAGGFLAGSTVQVVQSIPKFKDGKLVKPKVQQLVPESWLTAKPLSNPANRAGRMGVAAGALAGLVLGGMLGRYGAKHDEKHVHGLRVADHAGKGTSRWAGDRDIAHVCEFGPPREGPYGGGIVLGRLNGRIVRAMPGKGRPPLPGHAMVAAGTGAGKSYSFGIPNIIAAACAGESIVVTDPKGELACLLAPWLRKLGYKVYVFNLAYPEWGDQWNPILECRDDEEVSAFASAIINNAAKDSSGYFVLKEIQLLKALTYLLKYDFPVEQAHLRSALSLLSWPRQALAVRFEEAYRSGRLPQTGYESWRGVMSANLENAVSGVDAKLDVVRAESVARLLAGTPGSMIDLSAVGREKAALFCVLPVNSGHLKPVLATFYYFFFRRLYDLAAENGGKLPNPTRFILDEFANIGVIPGFVEIISTARSLGIQVQFILQGLKQLVDNYGSAEAEIILANCPVQMTLGSDDAATSRYFSSRLGDAPVWTETERHDTTVPWRKYIQLPRKTESISKRALMKAEEISRMEPLDAIALIRWCLPVYLTKVGWPELPQAEEIKALAVERLAEVVPKKELRLSLPEMPEEEPEQPEERRRGGRDTKKDQKQDVASLLGGGQRETERLSGEQRESELLDGIADELGL